MLKYQIFHRVIIMHKRAYAFVHTQTFFIGKTAQNCIHEKDKKLYVLFFLSRSLYPLSSLMPAPSSYIHFIFDG